MKYWVYSYIWGRPGRPLDNCMTGLFSGGSVVELFEFTQKQPENWCITCVVEISKQEYDAAKGRGKLG